MKRSPTGIFVIALLSLMIINHIYNRNIHFVSEIDPYVDPSETLSSEPLTEGFGVLNGIIIDENDYRYTEYNSITLELTDIPQNDNQTNYDYLKNQIINTVKMFNAKLESYIKLNIDNRDLSDLTNLNKKHTINRHAISFINEILPQLFDNLSDLASDYLYGIKNSNTFIPDIIKGIVKQDNTVSADMLRYIRLYFKTMKVYLQVVLYQLLEKHQASVVTIDNITTADATSSKQPISLYTTAQLTDPDNTSEPSIIHFLIKCDENSGLMAFLNMVQNGMPPAITTMDFFISNSINYVVNNNFTLIVQIDFSIKPNASSYVLLMNGPYDTIDTHISELQYDAKKKVKQLTESDVMNSVSPLALYTSLIGKIVACIIIGMVALVLAIYYYVMSQGTKRISSSENPRQMTSNMMTYMNVPNAMSSVKNFFSNLKMPKLPDKANMNIPYMMSSAKNFFSNMKMPNVPKMPVIKKPDNPITMPTIPGLQYVIDNPNFIFMGVSLIILAIVFIALGSNDSDKDKISWVNREAKMKEYKTQLNNSKTMYSNIVSSNITDKSTNTKEKLNLNKNKTFVSNFLD